MCRMGILFEQKLAVELKTHFVQGDGAGFYSIPTGMIYKNPNIDAEDILTVMEDKEYPMVIHERKVSVGEKTIYNTQPFKFGHIIFCHNGTIKKSALLKRPEVMTKNFLDNYVSWSDSRIIASHLKDLPLEACRKYLEPYRIMNNFIVYSEIEKAFLVVGRFECCTTAKGQSRAILINMFGHRIPSVKYEGAMIFDLDGYVLMEDAIETFGSSYGYAHQELLPLAAAKEEPVEGKVVSYLKGKVYPDAN